MIIITFVCLVALSECDTRPFYGGEPCTNRNPCFARIKMCLDLWVFSYLCTADTKP